MQKDETVKLTEAIEDLDQNVEELDEHVELLISHDKFWRVFLKGVVGALGAAIGATVVIAIIVYVLQALAGAPFIGQYFYEILNTIQQNK